MRGIHPAPWIAVLVLASVPVAAEGELPDLTGSLFVTWWSDSLGIDVSLDNEGGGEVGPFRLQILLDGEIVQESSFSGLAWRAGAGVELYGVPDGDHAIELRVDPYGEVAESDESNNVDARTLLYFHRSHLELTILHHEVPVVPGDPHELRFRVCNHGAWPDLVLGRVTMEENKVEGRTIQSSRTLASLAPQTIPPAGCAEYDVDHRPHVVGRYSFVVSVNGHAPDATPEDNTARIESHGIVDAPVGLRDSLIP